MRCLVPLIIILINSYVNGFKQLSVRSSLKCGHFKASTNNEENIFVLKSDVPFYSAIACLQLIPPLAIVELPEPFDSIRRPISYFYFISTALLAVYLGAKRQDIKQLPNVISKKSAVLAPVVSSSLLFGLYFLLKYTNVEIYFDKIYQVSGTLLGLSCFDAVSTGVLGALSPNSVSQNTEDTGLPEGISPISSDSGLLCGCILAFTYLIISNFGGTSPEVLCALSFFNNMIALSIAVFSIGLIQVESFAVACAFLIGLFFYDIFWVFGTDVMMTVVTKVEAPIKFLFPAAPSLMASRTYPFSVLGLGDIVVPGVMAALARRIDENGLHLLPPPSIDKDKENDEKEVTSLSSASSRLSLITTYINKFKSTPVVPAIIIPKKINEVSYLNATLVGYSAGIMLAFTANEITKAGQPALLYLVPCMILSMLYAAYRNDSIKELWGKGLELNNVSNMKT
eukprot:gene7397-15102_t